MGNGEEGNGVKELGVFGVIEKERVSVNENVRPNGDSHKFEEENKETIIELEEIPLKSESQVAIVNSETKVEPGMKEETTKEINVEDAEAKMNINADMERTGVERLATIERLAEKERKDKVKRREELDRIARLQRILALVRAPELGSVAKMKQGTGLELVEMNPRQNMRVLKEFDVMTEMSPALNKEKVNQVKEAIVLKPLTEHEPAVQGDLLATKKTIQPEGIAKLERMSKSERIAEIDRLMNLELEAEAKRKTETGGIEELGRFDEKERVEKMKRLMDIDLQEEMEKAGKERKVENKRLAEKERQEKTRLREASERVAKLQRILAVEVKEEDLERIKEMKRRDEMRLLEELGIMPKEKISEAENGKVNLEVGEKLRETTSADILSPNRVNLNENDAKCMKEVNIEVNEIVKDKSDLRVHTVASMKRVENDTKVDVGAESKRETLIKQATSIEEREKADRKQKREELERVANLQRIIAMVRNAEVKRVAEMQQTEGAEKKQDEDTKVLEELGVVPKVQVTQTQGGEIKQIEVIKPVAEQKFEDVSSMIGAIPIGEPKPEVKADVEPNVKHLTEKQIETKIDTQSDMEREAKIKRAEEIERKAKADREARRKQREELARVANLKRLVAMLHNEEFDHVTKMKNHELEKIVENKRREDMKVLEELGLAPKESEAKIFVKKGDYAKSNPVEDAIEVSVKTPTKMAPTQREFNAIAEGLPKRVIDIEQLSEKERKAVKEDVARRLTALRVAQMKLVAELGREMRMATTMREEDQREFNLRETEYQENGAEEKILAVTKMPEVNLEIELKMKGLEDSISEPKKEVESVGTKREGLKLAIQEERETEVESMELKRLREMKRVVGMERARGRDCEWDGQMMYEGKA